MIRVTAAFGSSVVGSGTSCRIGKVVVIVVFMMGSIIPAVGSSVGRSGMPTIAASS